MLCGNFFRKRLDKRRGKGEPPASPEFYSFPEKKLTREQLDAFWQDYEAGKRVRKIIADWKGREVIAVTKTVLGTVRRFANEREAIEYAERSK